MTPESKIQECKIPNWVDKSSIPDWIQKLSTKEIEEKIQSERTNIDLCSKEQRILLNAELLNNAFNNLKAEAANYPPQIIQELNKLLSLEWNQVTKELFEKLVSNSNLRKILWQNNIPNKLPVLLTEARKQKLEIKETKKYKVNAGSLNIRDENKKDTWKNLTRWTLVTSNWETIKYEKYTLLKITYLDKDWNEKTWYVAQRYLTEEWSSKTEKPKKDKTITETKKTKWEKEVDTRDINKDTPIKWKEDYEKRMKPKVESLEKALWLPNWISTSIIEQESVYWTKIDSWESKSIWLMQLNSYPFRDMIKSPNNYKILFSQIPNDIINSIQPENARTIFQDIKDEFLKDKPDLWKLKGLIKQIHKYARNMKWSERFDVLNIIMWSIYLAYCKNSRVFKAKSKWWEPKFKKINWISEISNNSIINDLINHKWYKLNNEDKELIHKIIASLKKDLISKDNKDNDYGINKTKQEFLTAREYNGTSKKVWYAINVIVARRFNEEKAKQNLN